VEAAEGAGSAAQELVEFRVALASLFRALRF
jgi:hypothetical protein